MPESSESDPFGAAAPPGLESTARLIERAQAGDQEAIDRLLARHLQPLRRWARGRLPKWARDLAETDDLVQDTLLQTFKRIGDFECRGVGALQAYLREAILNRVRDELRRTSRRPSTTELDGLEVNPGLSPLEEAIGRESIERYEQRAGGVEAGRSGGRHRPAGDGVFVPGTCRRARKAKRRRGPQSRATGARPPRTADESSGQIARQWCVSDSVRRGVSFRRWDPGKGLTDASQRATTRRPRRCHPR